MRKLAIVFVAGIVVVLAVLGYAALNLNSYLQANRHWLAERASEALGREVRFEEVGLSLHGGLGAAVDGLSVGEAREFGDEPFLEVGAARVLVNPWAALRGDYEVSEIVLHEPRIRIVRTARGFNVATLGQRKDPVAGDDAGTTPKGGGAPLPLFVSSLRVVDGLVRYVDRTASPSRAVEIVDVDVEVDGIGGAAPVRISLAVQLVPDGDQDIFANGTVGPLDLAAPTAAALDLTATIGPLSIAEAREMEWFADVVPEELESSEPLAIGMLIGGSVAAPEVALSIDASDAAIRYGEAFRKPAGVAFRVDGRLHQDGNEIRVRDGRLRVAEATADVSGAVRVEPTTRYDLRITGDAIPLAGWDRLVPALAGYDLGGKAAADLAVTGTGEPRVGGTINLDGASLNRPGIHVAGLNTSLMIDADRVTLPASRFELNGAPTELSARYDLAPQSWTISADIVGLALGPLLGEIAPAAGRVLEGLLDARLELRGRGTRWDVIRDALRGGGRATVRDGVLRDLNVADEVLSGLTGMQGLTNLISPRIRSTYPGLLQADDTPFETMGGRVRIDDGKVRTEDFALSALQHDITGEGWLSLRGAVDMTATLLASPALTEDLTDSVRELRALVDEQGRLRVPFTMQGELPGARPQPDMDYLVRRLGRSALESGLDRLFRKDEEAGGEGRGAEGPTPTPRVEEQLLRRGLKSLFGD